MRSIGIDIGGTSIKGIVVNREGEILHQTKVETDANKGKEHILEKTRFVIASLIQLSSSSTILGIGIGTAGRVNAETGEIAYATANLPGWQGTNLKTIFESEFGLPVYVDNDANTALLGEAWLGAGKGYSDITMLTLGTGVGGANLIGGNLIQGASWNGGEWGHVIFVPGGRACNCGHQGCIEQYLSGTAFVREANALGQGNYANGMQVLEDYVQNVPAIVQMLNTFMEHLAITVYNVHMGINPQLVIIGGGLSDSCNIWWELFLTKLNAIYPGIIVRPAKLGNQAGSIGAAQMVFNIAKE